MLLTQSDTAPGSMAADNYFNSAKANPIGDVDSANALFQEVDNTWSADQTKN